MFHSGIYSWNIYYRIGLVEATGVSWGPTQEAGVWGLWPAVALSKEGYVIVVYSDRSARSGSEQYYRVGKINPYGARSSPSSG